MTLKIDLPPELERRLRAEAERHGEDAVEFARGALEKQLAAAREERAGRVAALMEQWNAEDGADPDSEPVWEIPPVTVQVAGSPDSSVPTISL